MLTGPDTSKRSFISQHKKLCLGVVFALCFLIVMCLRTGEREFMSPLVMLHNMTLWIRLSISDLFNTSLSLQRSELIAASP